MTALYTTLGFSGLIALLAWLYGRGRKREGFSEADKAIAENAKKLKEKQLEISAEKPFDRDAVLKRMQDRLF